MIVHLQIIPVASSYCMEFGKGLNIFVRLKQMQLESQSHCSRHDFKILLPAYKSVD